MRTILVALLWLGSVQALFAKERRGKFTIYKRADDDQGDFFPFPANQSSIVSADTEPSDAPAQDLTVNATTSTESGQIPRHFIEKGCDARKKFKITNAWAEAKLLADAQTTFVLGYNYDIPHSQWLGKDWNSESSWIPWRYNYRKLIGDNFRRLAKLFSDNAQSGEYIYWYCGDHADECSEGVQAYAWDELGYIWSNHYTVFCDPFYDRDTLSDLMVRYNDDQHEQKVMENFQISSGSIMFHEIWHYKNLVSSPRTEDYAYQARNVWDLAKDKGTGWAYVNADSYSLDAVAIYVQQHYKSSMSPVPWRELSRFDATAAAAVAEPPTDKAVAKTFDQTPPGWNGPLVLDDRPDPETWQEIFFSQDSSSTPMQAATPVCSGNPMKWAPRDPLSSAIPSFCADAESQGVQDKDTASIVRSYLSGKDAVELSIDWPSGAPWWPTQDDCIGHLTSIMDDCDTNADGHNPMNWKHGGSSTSGVATYNIIPQVDRGYTPGTCAFHLHEEQYYDDSDDSSFYLQTVVKDSSGAVILFQPNSVPFGKDQKPYVVDSFYALLEMIPESQGGNYIRFTIGSLSWTTKNASGQGRCNTGDWDGDLNPSGRDMDCFFPC